MKMTKQDAFDRFGSYLDVRGGDYDAIDECLGDYEEARKNHTVGEDEPHPWYFPNTKPGLAAAKMYALKGRIERRTSPTWYGIEYRKELIESTMTKIRIARAHLFRNKDYLSKVEAYKVETADMIDLNLTDTVDKIEIVLLKDELELGLILDLLTPVYVVSNDYGGVKMVESLVTSYSLYGLQGTSYTSEGRVEPTVDITIYNNFNDGKGGRRRGHIANDGELNGEGCVNQKTFVDKDAALEQARVWAQELADKNSKWL